MKIKQAASLAGAVIVFLLSVATLVTVPTTVEAEDCGWIGFQIGAWCYMGAGSGQPCFSCVADSCYYWSGNGADSECANTCLAAANPYCF